MEVTGIDERHLVQEHDTGNFVVFVYTGGDAPRTSWSVDSYLLTDTQLSDALRWLSPHVPADSCWSLGVVLEPDRPTRDSDLRVAWIIGADVLNRGDPQDGPPWEQRTAEEMLARRHRVTFP
jgi:hypothetical protein